MVFNTFPNPSTCHKIGYANFSLVKKSEIMYMNSRYMGLLAENILSGTESNSMGTWKGRFTLPFRGTPRMFVRPMLWGRPFGDVPRHACPCQEVHFVLITHIFLSFSPWMLRKLSHSFSDPCQTRWIPVGFNAK